MTEPTEHWVFRRDQPVPRHPALQHVFLIQDIASLIFQRAPHPVPDEVRVDQLGPDHLRVTVSHGAEHIHSLLYPNMPMGVLLEVKDA